MPDIVYYVAASLDGFIADADGTTGWLSAFHHPDYYGAADFNASLAGVVMGSKTYLDVVEFSDSWLYPDVEAVVFTRQTGLPVIAGRESVRFAHGDVAPVAADLKRRLTGDIWLMGGADLAAQFLDAGMLDVIQLTVMPVLLGTGRPLFAHFGRRHMLDRIAHRVWDDGVMQATYRLRRG